MVFSLTTLSCIGNGKLLLNLLLRQYKKVHNLTLPFAVLQNYHIVLFELYEYCQYQITGNIGVAVVLLTHDWWLLCCALFRTASSATAETMRTNFCSATAVTRATTLTASSPRWRTSLTETGEWLRALPLRLHHYSALPLCYILKIAVSWFSQ